MIDPEKKLWQSVLLTAVNDALTQKKYKNTVYTAKITEDAKEWLLNNDSHYFRVCSMADINPLALREKVKEVLSFNKEVLELQGNNLAGKLIDDISSFES